MGKDKGKKKKTFCKFVSKEYLEGHFEEYLEMVRGPRYICCKCGRATNSEDNVCRPQKI